MESEQLIIFVKAPRVGEVKTRLATAIGACEACQAYRRLVNQLLHNLAPLPHVQLRFSPDDAQDEIQIWQRNSWSLRPQGEGDLGDRVTAAFADSFGRGAQRVVVIGSDCPSVQPEDIQLAWTELKLHDVVIGPATDGGYWSIGLNRPQTSLFQGISWSTGAVLRETLARAQSLGLKVKLLRELSDVDTETDWNNFLAANHRPPPSDIKPA